jgi:hypothetical protein
VKLDVARSFRARSAASGWVTYRRAQEMEQEGTTGWVCHPMRGLGNLPCQACRNGIGYTIP